MFCGNKLNILFRIHKTNISGITLFYRFKYIRSKMSIYFSGTFTRSAGILSAINKQIKLLNLKPVKRIDVQFDPFHPNAVTARNFLIHISNAKVLETNLGCIIKPNVVCDRSEPEINIRLTNSSTIKFLTNNLTVLDILKEFNKHISSTVKEDLKEAVVSKVPEKKRKKR